MAQDLSSIPIDIAANKLLDWLISRNHCTKEWPEKIAVVRQKINDALQDMPQNDTLAKILVEASRKEFPIAFILDELAALNYYHCLKIVDVLKETEADSKNIFGMYGSRRMKDWQEILKLYQKDNLHLAECASILGRTVIYEIPSLKRLNTKLEQSQAECLKKETTCKKQAQDYRDKFMHSCAQLGLNFEHFDSNCSSQGKPPTANSIGFQLVNQMSTKLPEIFDNISRKSKLVQPAVSFYRSFLIATVGINEAQEANCCGLLNTLIEKGNVTTYEWKYGEPPVKIEVSKLDYSFTDEDAEAENNGEFEFDLDIGSIDFSDVNVVTSGIADVELDAGEIDWGGTDLDTGVGEIDFSVNGMELDASGIVLEDDGIEGGVARDEDAMSILENVETRNQFIDDLYELQGFLSQRIDETKNEKNNDMMFSDNDDSIRADNLEGLLVQVNKVIGFFSEIATKQYLLIRESKRYIIRLAESLLQNLKLSKKLDFMAENAAQKYSEQAEEIKQITPKINILSKQSRELQTELAKEISKKYNNRNVYITGL